MKDEKWLRFPIYLNGEKHFDGNPSDEIEVGDAIKRMNFVFEHIEFCYAEGLLLDMEILDRLEELDDRLRDNDEPTLDQFEDLVASIGAQYGLADSMVGESIWIRHDENGQLVVWIDRDRIVAENNQRLFGK